MERFSANVFTDFKGAIQYDESGRNFMQNIKKGVFTKDQYTELINNKLVAFKELKSNYMEQPINETVKETLANLLYEMIVEHVLVELQER